MHIYIHIYIYKYIYRLYQTNSWRWQILKMFVLYLFHTVQPNADRLAQNLEIILKTVLAYQNSIQGIYK